MTPDVSCLLSADKPLHLISKQIVHTEEKAIVLLEVNYGSNVHTICDPKAVQKERKQTYNGRENFIKISIHSINVLKFYEHTLYEQSLRL